MSCTCGHSSSEHKNGDQWCMNCGCLIYVREDSVHTEIGDNTTTCEDCGYPQNHCICNWARML